MAETASRKYVEQLRLLMRRVGIVDFKALRQKAGVSKQQIKLLRQGLVGQMRLENLVKIAQALQVQTGELLGILLAEETTTVTAAQLQEECARLRAQLEMQRQELLQEFQRESLQILESWLIQWPTAAHAAREKPDLPAERLLPLLRPLEQLLQKWGVEAIATVGTEIPYDPKQHQLMEGVAQPGEPVKVRYTGYRQGDNLLYRAKVSPLKNSA